MNRLTRPATALLLALLPLPALADAVPLAPGAWLVSGGFTSDRQPDGNSVIWQGSDGLVVLDTGRHAEHSQAIIALADSLAAPVAAIVNSHWHLDHVSGNPRLKARWPAAKVYASNAIDAALSGFLQNYVEESRGLLARDKLAPAMAQDVRGDLATLDNASALRPDVVIDHSQTLTLAGRPLQLNLTRGATLGDIWVYDPAARLVATGDLVTLPTPFLDTACPQDWSRALDAIAATRFVTLVPGHGAPMTRAGFARYRSAFANLLTCAAKGARDCAEGWIADTGSLLSSEDQKGARGLIAYYVTLLRRPPPPQCG